MTIYLNDQQKTKSELADIVNSVRTTTFKDLVKKSQIYFNPSNNP